MEQQGEKSHFRFQISKINMERIVKVEAQRGNLLSYIIFLRITPFLPNWFINIVSPVIGVPLLPFWVGSFIGVAPPSFVFIQVSSRAW